jgi:hypothetical protein
VPISDTETINDTGPLGNPQMKLVPINTSQRRLVAWSPSSSRMTKRISLPGKRGMPSAERILVNTHALLWWQAKPDQTRLDRTSTTASSSTATQLTASSTRPRSLDVPLLSKDHLLHGYTENDHTVTIV